MGAKKPLAIPAGNVSKISVSYTTGNTVIPGDLKIVLNSDGNQVDYDKVELTGATGTSVTYYVEDMLGTSRVVTNATGVVCYDADFYPYGGERPYVNTCAQNYKFEGKERGGETGNDDFGARYYSNRFGRWLSADWSAVPVAIPYANLTNPQTLNLYSMVADDPESFADLDGHCQVEGKEHGWVWCQLHGAGFIQTQKEKDAQKEKEKQWEAKHGGMPYWYYRYVLFTLPGPGALSFEGEGAALVGAAGEAAETGATTGAGAAAEAGVNLADEQATTHILEGDATGGGHAPGASIAGKSEFPAGWSNSKILHAISDVATDPASKTVTQGRTTIVTGVRDGVEIKVVLRDNRIVTGYPTNVPRNP